VIYNVLSTEDGKDMVGDGGGALYKTVRKWRLDDHKEYCDNEEV
jgi:hypothetical protein